MDLVVELIQDFDYLKVKENPTRVNHYFNFDKNDKDITNTRAWLNISEKENELSC